MTPNIQEVLEAYELLRSTPGIHEIIDAFELLNSSGLKNDTLLKIMSSSNNNNNNGVLPQKPNVETAMVVAESSDKPREERKESAIVAVESSQKQNQEVAAHAVAVAVDPNQKELMVRPEPPKARDDSVSVVIDKEEYEKEVRKHQFSLIGKLLISRGEWSYNMKKLKKKLSLLWKIEECIWKLVPLGYGYFTIFICSMEVKRMILSTGDVFFLNPGTFKLFQWVPNFQATKLQDPPGFA